jgi:arylsulfatase A-like enzyme
MLFLTAPTSDAPEEPSIERRSRRPNVLIFVTDDQRIGTLKHMPATRRLIGRKGVTFSNAFVTTPLCCPARASIMTGQYAHNHHVRRTLNPRKLDMSTTLQHNLQEAGYLTAIVGKFLNGWDVTRVPPGFDRSVLLVPAHSRFAGGSNAYYDAVFSLNGRKRTVKRYATDFIRSRTSSILRQFNRRDRRPWMMYVNPFAPHAPAVPARRHAGAPVGTVHSNPAIRNRNRNGKTPDVRRRSVDQSWRGFAADQKRTLLAVDELVAKVFKRLTRLKEARNTLVIFMSDNGMMWGEHGLATKRFPYTHSIKVPMLMRWPGHVRPNSSAGRLVANIDVAPTVYHATGVEPAHVMDGRSLFTGRKRRFALLENWENTHWRSVRSRRYQYIEYYGEGQRLRFRELYRLKRDPWQLRNLLHQNARRHRAIAARLHRLLVRKAKCKGAECL